MRQNGVTTSAHQRAELARFLKMTRDRRQPAGLGLTLSPRRRAPGLLREEVASLAGISATWYTWMEQARPTNPSLPVLQRLAQVLDLDIAERQHLIALARPDLARPDLTRSDVTYPDPAAATADAAMDTPAHGGQVNGNHSDIASDISPPRACLADNRAAPLIPTLRGLLPHAAYVIDSAWNVLAWNAAATELFGDFAKIEPQRRNIMELLVLDPTWRNLFVDWQQVVEVVVPQYRANLAKLGADAASDARIARMIAGSDLFARLWQRVDVQGSATWQKRLNHPTRGATTYDYIALQTDRAMGDLWIVVYTSVEI